jgi:hypothetical protein
MIDGLVVAAVLWCGALAVLLWLIATAPLVEDGPVHNANPQAAARPELHLVPTVFDQDAHWPEGA